MAETQTQQMMGRPEAERRRVEAVVETLAMTHRAGESLSDLTHDARNMVTALGLYCDLLEEPGVLAEPYVHYGNGLRLVAAASRRLIEKLVILDTKNLDLPAALDRELGPDRWPITGAPPKPRRTNERVEPMPPTPIQNFAGELIANRNLLAALAGPGIQLGLDTEGGAISGSAHG